MNTSFSRDCDCFSQSNRRGFIKTGITAVAAVAAASIPGSSLFKPVGAEEVKKSASETLVASLYKTLTEEQRKAVCLEFDHPLRSKVDNNWHITDKKIGQFLTADQQALVKEIFMKLHSPEYAGRVYDQVVHDSGKAGFEDCSVALFGEPGSGKFEFVLTGRHCTRRCDGDSVEGAAFGGPIFYGHAAKGFNEKADHPGNAYWFQALQANEVFKMLDGKQREHALLGEGREEKGPIR